jgi:universal stress protein E
MQRFKKILVSVDVRSVVHPVLERAATMAQQNGASLKIVDVVQEFAWPLRLVTPDYEHIQQLLTQEKQQLLDSLAVPLRERGIDVTTTVLHGTSSLEIVRDVQRDGHDLVMREAKGPSSRSSGFFGNTSLRLLRKCPCPLWVVNSADPAPIEKVLAAVDPMPHGPEHAQLDATIMELAQSLCKAEEARLYVAHAWGLYAENVLRYKMGDDELHRLEDSARAEVERNYNGFLADYGLSTGDENVLLLKGDPGDVISQVVRERGIDLIVMGTVAHQGVFGMVMGSTAETVLQRVECSVLAIKPPGFVSPVH